MNIIASQNIDPLYYSFVSGDLNANVKALHQLQGEPEYNNVLAIERDIYGQNIDSEISRTNQQREKNIQKLEEVLQTNPRAKEILYALSVLHKENHQDDVSKDYLRRAREIDPLVK